MEGNGSVNMQCLLVLVQGNTKGGWFILVVITCQRMGLDVLTDNIIRAATFTHCQHGTLMSSWLL